jgi:tRNA(Ile)-lysidine synthase
MSLDSFIQQALSQQPIKGRWVIAYSGGLDSTVLLHMVAKANQQIATPKIIVALHVNHQLSTYANEWESHCQQIAEALAVDWVSERVDVLVSGKGIEAAARKARYRVFESFLVQDDTLLMAHHANDQAETFLLRLMRGAGVLGLSAMRSERRLGAAKLCRPLLDIGREALEAYAGDNNLSWVEDDSNTSLDFDRNFLRHKVIPIFLSRWPQAVKQLCATSSRLDEAQQLLNDLAIIDLQALDERTERYGHSITYKKCATLSPERITNVLRYWCEQKGFARPSGDQLAQIHLQFFSMKAQLSSAIVAWADCECRQFNGRFYLMPLLKKFTPSNNIVVSIDVGEEKNIKLGVVGELTIDRASFNDLIFNTKKLSVRWRQGGERCTPIDRAHSQTVKKLLQEYQLETWLRDRVPLIYYGDQLIAVGDLWLCKEVSNYIGIGNSKDAFLDDNIVENSDNKKPSAKTDANKVATKIVAKDLFVWSVK